MPSTERVEYISVYVGPEETPDPGPCILCNSATEQVFLRYQLRDNPVLVKNRKLISGYRCVSCKAEYFDGSVGLMLDKATLPKLPGHSKVRAALEQNIAATTTALDRLNPR